MVPGVETFAVVLDVAMILGWLYDKFQVHVLGAGVLMMLFRLSSRNTRKIATSSDSGSLLPRIPND